MKNFTIHPKAKNVILALAIKDIKGRNLRYCRYACNAVKNAVRTVYSDQRYVEIAALLPPVYDTLLDDITYAVMRPVAPKTSTGEQASGAWLSTLTCHYDSFYVNDFRVKMLMALKNKKGHVKYRKFIQGVYSERRMTHEQCLTFISLAE